MTTGRTKTRERVSVVQDGDDVVDRPVLAKAIVEISRSMVRLLSSGLTERAIICLVHDLSHVGKPDIRSVLAGLKQLEREFTRGRL